MPGTVPPSREPLARRGGPLLASLLPLLAAAAAWLMAAQSPGAVAQNRMGKLAIIGNHTLEVPFDRVDWPTFSPSGDTIAFSAVAQDGRRHIFTIPGSGGSPRQVTQGNGDDWSARYSADGRRLAFVSNRSGNKDIWIVPAQGGEPKAVTSDPADDLDPEWSPDGLRIVFASRRGGPMLLYQALLADLSVYALSAGMGEDRRPAWSPDGQTIAFQSSRDGRRHLFLIPADGGDARRVGKDDAQEESWPAWLPDGGGLVAQVGTVGSPSRLHVFPLQEGGSSFIIPIPPTPGRPGAMGAPPPSLSKDGMHLVAASGGEAAIEVLKVSGGGPSTVVSGGGRLRNPRWSKDGRRLLLGGDLNGAWDLWISGLSSGRLTRLTDDDDREMDPSWSLATGDVLYVAEEASGTTLRLLEPETKRTLRLGGGGAGSRDTEPAWSPDARQMAFVSERGGSRDIWVGPIGGGEPKRLTTLAGSETHPSWSPDGQWIAFASDQGKGSEIWKIPLAGGAPVRLSQLKEGFTGDTQPDWSPSGNYIAFTRALSAGGSDVYMITPDGQNPFPIRRGSGARIMDPAWSPSGEHLAYSFSRKDNIVVMDLGIPAAPPPAPPMAPGKGPGKGPGKAGGKAPAPPQPPAEGEEANPDQPAEEQPQDPNQPQDPGLL